ncbi:MAG: hypothetical protein ACE5GJ_10980 [Gemmatimonadota bacterium]
MVGIPALWLPIVVAAVVVFIASSVIHTMLQYHNSDFRKLPAEDDILDAVRSAGVAPGDYMAPHHGGDSSAFKDEAFREKVRRGPVVVMTVFPEGDPFDMKAQLTQWFVYLLVVTLFAAYITGRALGPGAEYLHVFRFAGATAFIGYALGHWQRSIWYKQAWSTSLKNTFDGLVYGLLTGGVFGWLWPS